LVKPTVTEDNATLYCYKVWNQNVEKQLSENSTSDDAALLTKKFNVM
jgi:hypothetical protein